MDNPCQGLRSDSEPCSKGAMGVEARKRHRPDDVPQLCYWCWRGTETMVRTGGKAYGAARRKKTISSVADVYTYDTILEVVAPALAATIEEPGIAPGTPDWSARLCACALLIECFPDYIRTTPEETRELLDKLLPERIGRERLAPEAAYRALAEERHRLRERGHPLAPCST